MKRPNVQTSKRPKRAGTALRAVCDTQLSSAAMHDRAISFRENVSRKAIGTLRRLDVWTFLLAMPLLLGGCRLHLNQQTGFLDGPTLPALDEAPESSISDAPSVTNGHDRRHWQTQRVIVPVNQTEYHPHYAGAIVLGDAVARQRSEYPTADTVLEIEPLGPANAVEGPINVVYAGALFVIAPIEMVFKGRLPWTVERGVQQPLERRPLLEVDDLSRWYVISDYVVKPVVPTGEGDNQ